MRRRFAAVLGRAVLCGAMLAVLVSPAQAAQPAQAPAQGPECASLENCYGYPEMQAFYDQIIVWVDEFSRASYASMPSPDYVYVAAGTRTTTGCGSVADSLVYAFCGLDDTVYVGQDQLFEFYTTQGDAAAAVGIAHEWGHHVQWVAGIRPVDRLTLITLENQADCIAGAWVGFVNQQGRLETDDVDDINAILEVIASAEGTARDHGTLAERTASMQRGFDTGLTGCNAYFPAQPVLA
ncbi:hypothetical protein BJF78_27015 [Pseudonocardia sp. CNS-139]|nr:hypothetical protein BJF78_27015 [Pseudonocardia sp. CNS-139]